MTAQPAIDISNSPAFASAALAAFCKASGDVLRLDILRALSLDSFGVLELSQIFAMPQSGMSHHLKILAKAGLVTTRREGNSIFYRRVPDSAMPELAALHRTLLESIDKIVLSDEVNTRIATTQTERARRSQQFFTENAGRFREQQELIAAFEVYGAQAAEMLAQCFPQGAQLALEVGPGEGAFLSELAQRFTRVIALDNSVAMLEQARHFANDNQLKNVECIHGDTTLPMLSELRADCAVLNMVLHHVPSPAQIFGDLAVALKPGGSLLITELCRHDQLWAESACGDLWLGFEPIDLTQWAHAAGFEAGRSVYIAQRNGFGVQIRQFIRSSTTLSNNTSTFNNPAKGN
jgi:ubiquinone/menaquinone biosynthesis C-methylase UbiE/DNA-binding transcriptional ArsR family regulator